MQNTTVSPFWTKWLLYTAIAVAINGAILTYTPLFFDLIGPLYYNTYFDYDAFEALESGAIDFQRFVYGVSGAVLMSWMACVGLITHYAFRHGEKWAWWAIAISTVLWFVGDGYASVASGFVVHAVVNLGLLIMIEIPLAATYKSFHLSPITTSRTPQQSNA